MTSNAAKATEVSLLLERPIDPISAELTEIQGDLETIALHKLEAARAISQHTLIATEDVAIGYDELGGFPGPYVKALLETAGAEGLALLGAGLTSRRATASCVVALWDGSEATLHRGDVHGVIVDQPRGSGGFGWDAWFLPDGSTRTFAEMSATEKQRISHRGIAWRRAMERLARLDTA